MVPVAAIDDPRPVMLDQSEHRKSRLIRGNEDLPGYGGRNRTCGHDGRLLVGSSCRDIRLTIRISFMEVSYL